MRKLILLPTLLIFFFSKSQSLDTLKQIDQLFSSWNNATPGGIVTISRGDKIIYNKAFGMADLEHKAPNTTETISESGSVAKQFTAMAALLLVSEGKLSLTDDIHKYISELPVYDAPVTIQQLLNHTSGLKDWGSVGGLTGWPRWTKIYTNELALHIMCKQKSTNFMPGSEYSYSNSNYTMLAIIVERVSGKSFADFTEERFFKPLGMINTKWRNNFREVVANRAIAYQPSKDGFEQNMPFENAYGQGALLTTTADLLRWNKLLETQAIGGNKVYQWRIQKGVLKNGKQIKYASGLEVSTYNGFTEINHTGATAGYRALLSYYPEKKLSIAVLSNDSRFDSFSTDRKLAELFIGPNIIKSTRPTFIAIDDVRQKKFAGIYKSIREFNVINFDFKDSNLLMNGKPIKSIHQDTLFENGTKWVVINPLKIISINQNDTVSYSKVAAPLEPKKFMEYKGEYTSEEAEVTYQISVQNNELLISCKPLLSIALKPSFKDGFTFNNDLYEFKRSKKGKVVALEVSVDRAERIVFTKKN